MSVKKKIFWLLVLGLAICCLIPEDRTMPVVGATKKDWNPSSFWYEPWGASGVHKGVDIFAKSGVPVLAATNQLLLYRGEVATGGRVILALGPKLRLHYYAHLLNFNSNAGFLLHSGQPVGSVGDSGNAKGKQPHLHYSVVSLIPLLWEIDFSTEGYKKAFYVNPARYIGG